MQYGCAKFDAKYCMKGEHVMRHKSGLWDGMSSDMFIETTYKLYEYGPNGIVSITLETYCSKEIGINYAHM